MRGRQNLHRAPGGRQRRNFGVERCISDAYCADDRLHKLPVGYGRYTPIIRAAMRFVYVWDW
ncbi:hypothetical protein [Paenibacillus taichungensis]|uniref:hypothetical protein n=1 Tax=Paenibacillus taichungensis TaxID=484184 RepID=UPI0028778B86|nr:hypothetical protein [Paenibacillus taichungensis]